MRHTALALFSASLLLAACDSGDSNSLYAPPSGTDETVETADMAEPPAETDPDTEETSRFNESGDTFDIAAALDEPLADGEWFTQPDWTGFGPPASEATFRLECSEYGMIELTRMMDADPAKPLRGMIAAGAEAQDGYWTAEDGAELPSAHMEVYAEAPIFDAMKEADRFAVMAEGKPALVVPADQSLNRQIETCRDRGAATP